MEVIIIAAIVIGGIVLLSLFSKPDTSAPLLGETFTCNKCKKTAKHNHRTINVWKKFKNNTRGFYCDLCHKKWVQRRHPPSSTQPSSSGCLGSLLILVAIPVTLVISFF